MPQVIDYDALAAAAGGAAVSDGAGPKGSEIDFDALAQAHGGQAVQAGPQMNTALVNGQPVPVEDEPNTLGTFVSHAAHQLNPVPLGQMVPFPKEAGGAGWDAPLKAGKDLLQAQGAVFDKAKQAYDQGDYVGAAAHALYWLMPVIGPVLDKAGTDLRQGKTAAGLGDTVGVAASLVGPKALGEATAGKTLKVTPAFKTPNPAEAAAVQFGQSRGIPVDAGTATGNQFVRGTQAMADASPLGSIVATRAKAAEAAALQRVGGELAQEANPGGGYVSPEQAGGNVTGGVHKLVGTMNDVANEAYGKLRKIEDDPRFSQQVHSAPTGSRAYQDIVKKLGSGGSAPTQGELYGMRQIEAELDATPFSKKILQRTDKGNSWERVEGVGGAGAPVYHEIGQAMTEGGDLTRGEMQAAIKRTLETGDWNAASRGALTVARKRLGMEMPPSGPTLSPDAPLLGGVEQVKLPVQLTAAKKALTPLYDRLKRESDLIPLQGEKGRVLVALDRLMSAPEHESVSIVDAALGDLKSMARSDNPEIKTQAQGLAGMAVKELDKAVKAAAAKAGPDALSALEEGRAATVGKYQAVDVLDQIKDEPVKAFRQMTAPQDSGIEFLRKVKEMAPDKIPDVARAYLENLLNTATSEGGFKGAAGLQRDWQHLGPATKRELFPDTGHVQSLDHFFLLAKKLAESPNPSGTALTGSSAGQFVLMFTNPLTGGPMVLGSGAVSKLLHSTRGVNALSRGIQVSLQPASGATKTAALLNLTQAARAVGADLSAVPAAADRDAPGAPN